MSTSKEKTVLTISQAAELLYVHPETLRRYEKDGLINSSKTSGGHRRFKIEEVKILRDSLANSTPPRKNLELDSEMIR